MGVNRRIKRNQKKEQSVRNRYLYSNEMFEAITGLKHAVESTISLLKMAYDDLNRMQDASVKPIIDKLEGGYELIVTFNNNHLEPIIKKYNEVFAKDKVEKIDIMSQTAIDMIQLVQQGVMAGEELIRSIEMGAISEYQQLKKELELHKDNVIEVAEVENG